MNAVKEIPLGGTWALRDEPIDCGPDQAGRIAAVADGWIDTPVPGDVRQGLIAAGRMPEPLEGLNSFDGHWVEDRSWWLRRVFRVPASPGRSPALPRRSPAGAQRAEAAELVLDGLDCNASVFLNGAHLGDHPSAFRPFVARVEDRLVAGENVLLVRLTHGIEHMDPADAEALKGHIPTEAGRGRPERGDVRRVFARKPQYTWGWDWAPRVATVCIAAEPKLRVMNTAVIRDVRVVPRRAGGGVWLDVTVRAEWLDWRASGAGRIGLIVRDPDGRTVARAAWAGLLQIGDNELALSVRIPRARLWWPNGMGAQDRYTVETTLAAAGATDRRAFKYGIRFLELENAPGVFALKVNGARVFCRGGNWIPPDSLYARVPDGATDRLVAEAARAHFTMLRVWGGGQYPPEAFFEACDREGLLVWQDFMLACAPYPDHLAWFRAEVAAEADHQTRRLRNHASLAVWCGSNECHYFLGVGTERQTDRVTRLLGRVLPEAVRRNCPEVPYWYSSPAGGAHANDPAVGDCHYWQIMMNADIDVRITPEHFDACGALFVSEFGYPGPCGRRTTEQYLAGAPFERTGRVWQHHNNTFEKDTVDAGIAKHFADPGAMSPDQYLLYGGLTQGLMVAHELEALRASPRCAGAILWMYNDTWGEVGWTIIDYYLRRKVAWYFVRRALAPRRLILRTQGLPTRRRRAGGRIAVTLANDAGRPARGQVEFGWVSLDGSQRSVRRKRFAVPSAEGKVIATFAAGRRDPGAGVWFARVIGDPSVLPATLRAAMPKDLATTPNLTVAIAAAGKGQADVTVRTDAYARAVELLLPDGAMPEDNYFELLPHQSRTVRVRSPRRLTSRNVSAACR